MRSLLQNDDLWNFIGTNIYAQGEESVEWSDEEEKNAIQRAIQEEIQARIEREGQDRLDRLRAGLGSKSNVIDNYNQVKEFLRNYFDKIPIRTVRDRRGKTTDRVILVDKENLLMRAQKRLDLKLLPYINKILTYAKSFRGPGYVNHEKMKKYFNETRYNATTAYGGNITRKIKKINNIKRQTKKQIKHKNTNKIRHKTRKNKIIKI
jgi:hypothetical protein